jgi:hypothetical protein
MFIKTTFIRTFSLCLLAGFSATLVSFSQTIETPVIQEAALTAQFVMPVARTLTSADGRKMDVVILSKTATGIKAKRTDGKEVELTLDKLSDADKAFVSGLVVSPVKKPTLLYIGYDEKPGTILKINDLIVEKLKTAGFEVHIELKVSTKTPEGRSTSSWPGIENMLNDQIKAFDVVWEQSGPRERLLAIYPTYQGVMVMHEVGDHNLKDFLADRGKSIFNAKPHVEVNDNLVRYDYRTSTWEKKDEGGTYKHGPIQPEFIDKAIAETQKILQAKPKTISGVSDKPRSRTKRVLYVMEQALTYDRRIMQELIKDGYDVIIAWDNETKPLPRIIKHADKSDSVFPVPTKSQFIRPEEASAQGFDALCIGTTTILKKDREKMAWSEKYLKLIREAEGLGLVIMVNSLDDYSKKQILSGMPKKIGKLETKDFLKEDENFIIYNRQMPNNLEKSPEDPTDESVNGKDQERRAIFNEKLKN